MKLLITLGGTREPLDAARSIANLSTGRTGAFLARALARRGCRVLCLCAEDAVKPAGAGIRRRTFSSFATLDAALRAALSEESFDAAIHLAAVSDYSPCLIETGSGRFLPGSGTKLDSSHETLRVTLRRNFKIIDRIKGYASEAGRAAPLLIGFKLTAGACRSAVLRKVRALSAADLIVHNDLEEMKGAHPFHVYRGGRKIADCEGAGKLAELLYLLIKRLSGNYAPLVRHGARVSKSPSEGKACVSAEPESGRRAHGVRDADFAVRASCRTRKTLTKTTEALCC